MVHDALPTATVLLHRGLQIPSLCVLCGEHPETLKHIFMDCSMTKLVWESLHPSFKLTPCVDFTIWLKQNACDPNFLTDKVSHGSMFVYCLWHIWMARNLKCFHHAPFSFNSVIAAAGFFCF